MPDTDYDRKRRPLENVAEALFAIAHAIHKLGTNHAATNMGALEALALEVKELPERMVNAFSTAMRELSGDRVVDLLGRRNSEGS